MVYNYHHKNIKGTCNYCENWEWDEEDDNKTWCPYQKKNVPTDGSCDKYVGI